MPFDYRTFLAKHPVLLAPMAGITDVVFRQLCIEQGASLTYTEMVSAKGLQYGNERTENLLQIAPNEDQVGVQLFGHEPSVMAQEAEHLCNALGAKLAVIDINMGCPARKIVTKGDGASLMQRPNEASEIIRAVSSSSAVPVTVKFRRGYSLEDETAPAFAEMAQESGAAAVTVHGRYAQQMYHGSSDRRVIQRVVSAVDIPVVGNGDICSAEDALAMRKETGCEAVMIARAAQGNPWIFNQVRAAFDGKPLPPAPSFGEKLAIMRRHARLLAEWEPHALVRMRKHASWYTKGVPHASVIRNALNAATTLEDFERIFDELETMQHA